MAKELKYGRILRLCRICGIALVVFAVVGLVYLAPLAVLARLEYPSGDLRFLWSGSVVNSRFAAGMEQNPKSAATILRAGDSIRWYLTIPILDTIYSPVLDAAGGYRNERSKFFKFILGFQ